MDPATSDTDRPDGTDGPTDRAWSADRDASTEAKGATDDGATLPMAARRRPRQVVAMAVAVALGITLLGAPLGLLWAVLAPDVPVVKTENGAVLANPQPEEFIAADGWFSLLILVFGILAALGVWWARPRWRGPLGLLVVVAGTLGAALVAWGLGRQVGLDGYRDRLANAPVGQHLGKPADLRAGGFEWLFDVIPTVQGVVLLGAFGATITYTLLAGWSNHPDLVPEQAQDVPATDQNAPAIDQHAPAADAAATDAAHQPPVTAAFPAGHPMAGDEVSSGSPEARDRQSSPAPPECGEAGQPRG